MAPFITQWDPWGFVSVHPVTDPARCCGFHHKWRPSSRCEQSLKAIRRRNGYIWLYSHDIKRMLKNMQKEKKCNWHLFLILYVLFDIFTYEKISKLRVKQNTRVTGTFFFNPIDLYCKMEIKHVSVCLLRGTYCFRRHVNIHPMCPIVRFHIENNGALGFFDAHCGAYN